MKTFTFHYDPHPAKSAIDNIAKAMKMGKGQIQSNSIACRSMEDMLRIMTKSRLDAFAAIVERAPASITELAEVLSKDVGNVQRDVVALQSLGLVDLKRRPAKRGVRLQPVALYQRIIFECEPKRIRETI